MCQQRVLPELTYLRDYHKVDIGDIFSVAISFRDNTLRETTTNDVLCVINLIDYISHR